MEFACGVEEVPEDVVRARSRKSFVCKRRVIERAYRRLGEAILSRVCDDFIEFREEAIHEHNPQIRSGLAVRSHRVAESGVETRHIFGKLGEPGTVGSKVTNRFR